MENIPDGSGPGAHRGHAGVRNVAGGCCFEITLPLAFT